MHAASASSALNFRRVRSRCERVLAAFAPAILVALPVGMAAAAGLLRPLENALQDTGFGLRARDASGQIHVIEIDAASIATVGHWP